MCVDGVCVCFWFDHPCGDKKLNKDSKTRQIGIRGDISPINTRKKAILGLGVGFRVRVTIRVRIKVRVKS